MMSQTLLSLCFKLSGFRDFSDFSDFSDFLDYPDKSENLSDS
jgi:hypothetical protein